LPSTLQELVEAEDQKSHTEVLLSAHITFILNYNQSKNRENKYTQPKKTLA